MKQTKQKYKRIFIVQNVNQIDLVTYYNYSMLNNLSPSINSKKCKHKEGQNYHNHINKMFLHQQRIYMK